MNEEQPRFSRRHWGREAIEPLSMFKTYRVHDGRVVWKWSQLRVMCFLSEIAFLAHFPDNWDGPAVTAQAVILFAIGVDALMARVPMAEGLGALQAIATSFAATATAKVQGVVNRQPTRTVESSSVETRREEEVG